MAIPAPRPAEDHLVDYSGWLVAVVTIDLGQLDDTTERVNITLPKRVLARIDAKAKALGESRSGFISRMAIG